MPRVRAEDYDDKKGKILDAAAILFAEHGYAGARMEQIAEACEVSKSMLYHYFKKKEDVLFEILQEHVLKLIETIKAHIERGRRDHKFQYFRGFVEVYLEPSSNARARHVVALHDMRYLTKGQQRKQVKLERDLLTLVEEILKEVNGQQDSGDYRISALLLMGMLNWIELWYRRSGRLSPSELYDRVAHLFLSGFIVSGGCSMQGFPEMLNAQSGPHLKRKSRAANVK